MIYKPVGQTIDLTSLSLEREGLRFKSRASHIGHGVANSSPPLQHFFKRSCVAQAQEHRDGSHQVVTCFGVLLIGTARTVK